MTKKSRLTDRLLFDEGKLYCVADGSRVAGECRFHGCQSAGEKEADLANKELARTKVESVVGPRFENLLPIASGDVSFEQLARQEATNRGTEWRRYQRSLRDVRNAAIQRLAKAGHRCVIGSRIAALDPFTAKPATACWLVGPPRFEYRYPGIATIPVIAKYVDTVAVNLFTLHVNNHLFLRVDRGWTEHGIVCVSFDEATAHCAARRLGRTFVSEFVTAQIVCRDSDHGEAA
jgi:hypothetical protein